MKRYKTFVATRRPGGGAVRVVLVEEPHGRFVGASIGSFHVCCWTFTMTEAWAWDRPSDELRDRSDGPWGDPKRRPSHADKRRARRREPLRQEIQATLQAGPSDEGIQATADRLLALAA